MYILEALKMQIVKISNGSISQRSRDKKYVCSVVITYADGSKKKKNKIAASKEAAKKAINLLKQECYTDTTNPVPSIDEQYINYLLTAWINEKQCVEQLEKSTIETHKDRINCYLKPYFKKMSYKDITSHDIINLHKQLSKKLSAESIHKVHAIIANSFKKLYRDNLVDKNPCLYIKLPKIVIKEKKPLTKDEITLLLNTAKEYVKNPTTQVKNIYPFLVLAIASGCRRGELCGLQWQDVDFSNNTINIRHAIEETRGGMRLKAPKTDKARIINIAPNVMELLKGHRQDNRGKYVFASKNDANLPQCPSSISRAFEKVRQLADLEHVTIHLLRHTHITLLATNGVDIRTIAQRAGHHNIQTTMRYCHSNDELDKKASMLFTDI
jgi:integrase